MSALRCAVARWTPGEVWRLPAYVRLWSASVISGLGSSVTALALPLLAALTLHATPFQMGLLVASETIPSFSSVSLLASGSIAAPSGR